MDREEYFRKDAERKAERAKSREAARSSKEFHRIAGRPHNGAVYNRFSQITNQYGFPFFLPTVNAVLADENGYVRGNPAGCAGPWNEDSQRRYMCNKRHFCVFCYERRCREGGLKAVMHHLPSPQIIKFSVSLPAARHDLEAVKQARKDFWEVCKKAGFTNRTIWIHAFGENPAHGPKGHLDGFVSGPLDADATIFHGHGQGFAKALAPYHENEAKCWDLHVENRFVAMGGLEETAKDLVLGGFYAGRPTFNTRRVFAGLYWNNGYCVRLTNINRKTRHPSDVKPLEINGNPQADWTQDQLLEALRTAEAWTSRLSTTRVPQFSADQFDVLLRATNWRRKYRLDGKTRLAELLT